MYSRGRKEIVSLPHIVEHVTMACKNVNAEWIDGELYSHDLSFNEMQSIIRKSKTIDKEKAKLIEYHCFDYISNNDFDKRNKHLADNFTINDFAKLVKSKLVNVKDLAKNHAEYIADGYEGIMVRTIKGGYEQKRSRTLFKYKTFIDNEFQCVGFELERGTKDKCGRITCKTSHGQEFGARPACTDAEKIWIWKNQKNLIGKMVTVEFQEYTTTSAKDAVPRFPIAKGFRDNFDMS